MFNLIEAHAEKARRKRENILKLANIIYQLDETIVKMEKEGKSEAQLLGKKFQSAVQICIKGLKSPDSTTNQENPPQQTNPGKALT